MIKLVVSDIDGTLLPEGTDLMNPEFYELVRKLKKQGIVFAAASGRQYESMFHVMKPVAEEIYFIAENGANVMYQGRNVSARYIQPEDAQNVIAHIRTIPECKIVLSTPEGMFVESEDKELMHILTEGYHNKVQYAPNLMEFCQKTIKLSLYRAEGVEPLLDMEQKMFGSDMNVTFSGHLWIDYMAKQVDKGSALTKLQNLLFVTKEETMAFGDNCNDIGLLQQAEYSYAVANAHPLLKEAARYETRSNLEDGVLLILKQKLLKGELS